jgi:lipoate-protein ligase A
VNSLRFIDDQARDGALNMALDDFLALEAEKPGKPTVLRLYQWERPTLSCGYHQKIEKRINLESCAKHRIQLARRPTGGRELLHENDLSFSITSTRVLEISAMDYFKLASAVIVGGLHYIGLEAVSLPGTEKRGELSKGPCLTATSQCEIICRGKKLVPIAQRVYPKSILVHGSIPLTGGSVSTAELLQVTDTEKLQEQIDKAASDLGRLTGKPTNLGELKKGLRASFESIFGGKASDLPLLERELTEASLLKEKWEIKA